MENLSEQIKTGAAVVIDVRSRGEFMGGHIAGSINIPLQEIPNRMNELMEMKKIILCCASGNRSNQAAMFLQQNGIDCMNGGSWMDVNCYC